MTSIGKINLDSSTTYWTSCRRATATICPAPLRRALRPSSSPYTPYAWDCGAQCVLLPVAVGSMNIRDVRDRRRQTDVRQHHCLMHPPRGRGHDNPTQRKTNIQNKHTDHMHFIASPLVGTRRQSQNHRLPFHSETTETSSRDWLRVSSKSVSGYWNRSQKGRLMLCFVDRLCPKVRCLDHR